MLVTHMLTNQDSMEINFSNLKLSYGAWSLTCVNIRKKPFKNIIHQSLLAALGDEDGYCMLMS